MKSVLALFAFVFLPFASNAAEKTCTAQIVGHNVELRTQYSDSNVAQTMAIIIDGQQHVVIEELIERTSTFKDMFGEDVVERIIASASDRGQTVLIREQTLPNGAVRTQISLALRGVLNTSDPEQATCN